MVLGWDPQAGILQLVVPRLCLRGGGGRRIGVVWKDGGGWTILRVSRRHGQRAGRDGRAIEEGVQGRELRSQLRARMAVHGNVLDVDFLWAITPVGGDQRHVTSNKGWG